MANAFGLNPNASLENALRAGATRVNSGISAANAGVGAASTAAGAMRGDASSMRGQARLVNTQGAAINQTADALAGLVPKLDPYVAKLSNYGDSLASLAQTLSGQTNDAFGQASALASMDPNATGLAGEFLRQYGVMSPDNYVSRAASDVEGAFSNVAAQQERDLARRGVDVGSGAGRSLAQTLNRMKATALAAAKTNALDRGLKDQRDYLSTITGAAKTFYDMGAEGSQHQIAAMNAAGDAQKGAAGVVAQQGSMISDVGRLRAEAGQLFGSAASIFGGAANVEGNAGELQLSASKTLAAAYDAAAEYYAKAASVEIGANTGRGGGGWSGGVNITPAAPGDDFMNWKNTGHSETWNKNNLPTDEFRALAANGK